MTDDLDTQWRPLSMRDSGDYAAYDALHPGVPPWLQTSLWDWVAGQIDTWSYLLRVERVFRLEGLNHASGGSMLSDIQKRMFKNDQFFLDVVDWLLSHLNLDRQFSSGSLNKDSGKNTALWVQLMMMLREAGSLWQIGQAHGRYHLERRVPPAVEAAARQVMSTGDKAAQHLTLAWNAVYGRQPDAGKGYREAIKAAEVVTAPIVIPADPLPTLGKVVTALRAKPAKWSVGLKHSDPDGQVRAIADMLDLIWKGQSDRHGDPDPAAPISVSQEQAQAAVHLAVTVVQWFTTGVVTTV